MTIYKKAMGWLSIICMGSAAAAASLVPSHWMIISAHAMLLIVAPVTTFEYNMLIPCSRRVSRVVAYPHDDNNAVIPYRNLNSVPRKNVHKSKFELRNFNKYSDITTNGDDEYSDFDFGTNRAISNNGENQKRKDDGEKTVPRKPAMTTPEVNQWTAIMADEDNVPNKLSSCKSQSTPDTNSLSTSHHQAEIFYKNLEDMSIDDNGNVEKYWDILLPKISYLGISNVMKVKQALRVAYRAHRSQIRKSGEPFIIHPLEVAQLLSELKMDAETVMSGLLHDTVEDTDLTFSQVESMFGPIVRSIVEGETKVSKLPKLAFEDDYADEQAENLRQMFVAMTDDYRIIIVKLADRLHNMRTLRHMKPHKQIKISRETLDIFAPLAHRMGIWQFKSELEDTAFMYLYPKEYKSLNKRLRRHQTRFRDTLDKSQQILRETLVKDFTLKEQGTGIEVYGRTKEIYSLWHKMQIRQDPDLDHISDVVALRVILDPNKQQIKDLKEDEDVGDRGVWLCYHVLGLVQHLPGFQPVPTKVKDYISFPKPNGYQSLHTSLMLNGQTIEVQIRTSAMHQVAEFGMASHWAYTDEKRRTSTSSMSTSSSNSLELFNTPWLSSIKEWQEDIVCSRDFVDCVRRELLGKRVFVFLRSGKILNLTKGATAIDAAFHIHTEVGIKMHGVEINGKPVPFSYELQNGDVVSILTGEGKPATDWMRYAKTRSTRAKLRSYFRSKQRDSLREAGQILLEDFLHVHADLLKELTFLEGEVPTTLDQVSKLLPGSTRYPELDDLLIDLGRRHDRDFMRSKLSKLFKVPLSALLIAEKGSPALQESVQKAIQESRKLARDAGKAASQQVPGRTVDDKLKAVLKNNSAKMNMNAHINGSPIFPQQQQSQSQQSDVVSNKVDPDLELSVADVPSLLDQPSEFADPEQLCGDCLPLRGDDIVGTRPPNNDDVITTVHRHGCIHAIKALNRPPTIQIDYGNLNSSINVSTASISSSDRKNGKTATNNSAKITTNEAVVKQPVKNGKAREINRIKNRERFSSAPASTNDEIPIKLKWPEEDIQNSCDTLYLAEVVVVASDRKHLLADCSVIVSDTADIVKTGSLTTNEHATLEFLVKVKDLNHLQELMDHLVTIQSVMSVERKFGTDLL